jgi:transaldolase
VRHPRGQSRLDGLRIKLFADGADLDGILAMYANPLISGFTTNPTLMRKAGVDDYETFARNVLAAVPDRPVSLEVFADDFAEMMRQARVIASWAPNVNVKIPVTNTRGDFSGAVIRDLSAAGVILNVTAIQTLEQVRRVTEALAPGTAAIVSVFAGRVADTGVDPVPLMREAVAILAARPRAELLWASPRELLNIFQADAVGCHIITATNDILAKLPLVGKDLGEYSLETVEMFRRDALAAGYTIAAAAPAEGAPAVGAAVAARS